MTLDSIVVCFAGTVVLIGTALGAFVHPLWLILPAFVGLNMMQASITGFCPAAFLLKKMGFQSGPAFPPRACCCKSCEK